MMIGLWDIVVGEGMLNPRGYSPLYLFELVSHRLLRYLSPALHLILFLANLALREGVTDYDRRHGYRGPEAFATLPDCAFTSGG